MGGFSTLSTAIHHTWEIGYVQLGYSFEDYLQTGIEFSTGFQQFG
jgi:hypothetical protein